ncbi:MAG: CDP-glycerol glycerophosphotransferase family protein [Candidatus Marinimicrobia bacterium]|nr:CDP-glycerol glycerophosphotransferase family protein [Candidatus Neomarinimicrobiota bacterium]
MVFSSYFNKIPYVIMWYIAKHRKRLINCVAYCAEPLDYFILAPVINYLDRPCVFVAKNRETANFLKKRGYSPLKMPVFPETVLMARHSAWKFPVKSIHRFGFRHGPYHFKTFTSPKNYHAFTLFFLTSPTEEKEAREVGIKNGVAIGYPKLDPAFDGTWTQSEGTRESPLEIFRRKTFPNNHNPILLFSATWDKSGMSAINLWYHRLTELTHDFKVCVTLHPWMSKKIYDTIQKMSDVYLVSQDNLLPVMLLADLTISDTSSIIGEFIALDKRIITFKSHEAPRKPKELEDILQKAGYGVETFEELKKVLLTYLSGDDPYQESRRELRDMMFCNLGTAGKKAAEIINKYL